MVENAHEQHPVEFFFQFGDLIDGHTSQFNFHIQDLSRELSLLKITRIAVDAEDAAGETALHLDGIETGVAAHVENAGAGEIIGDRGGKFRPLERGIVAQKMIGRGPDTAEVEIMEPGSEFLNPLANLIRSE